MNELECHKKKKQLHLWHLHSYFLFLQKERERTKGSKWFNMPATELTDELKNDLEVLRMRSVLDPKHFYKKNDLKVLPKYFQVRLLKSDGEVISSNI
jgi:hypothetical protein